MSYEPQNDARRRSEVLVRTCHVLVCVPVSRECLPALRSSRVLQSALERMPLLLSSLASDDYPEVVDAKVAEVAVEEEDSV